MLNPVRTLQICRDVRTRIRLIGVIHATLLCWACGDVTGVATGPSPVGLALTPGATAVVAQDFPTLTGRWRALGTTDRKSTRLNCSHSQISYAVFCLKKKKKNKKTYNNILTYIVSVTLF